MISNLITIGFLPACDYVIEAYDYIKERPPVCAQIYQKGSRYYLQPFTEDIRINNVRIDSPLFGNIQDSRGIILLDLDDIIDIKGVTVFWQQWMYGLGLCCDRCRYAKLAVENDNWCNFCKRYNHNPGPYIKGYSNEFNEKEICVKDIGRYNYVDCKKCTLVDWCVECTFLNEAEPLNRSFKDHVEMYVKRIEAYELILAEVKIR